MKRILPVAILFAVLLALVVVRETSRARLDERTADRDEFVPLAAAKFVPGDAARIEVIGPGETEPAIVVERDAAKDAAKGDAPRWTVTKPYRCPGHSGNAAALVEALAVGDAEFRADDAGALHDLDLEPGRAVTVRLSDASGRPLAHVAIGRGTGQRGAFVRFPDRKGTEAFETTSDLRGLLGLGRGAGADAPPEEPKATHFRDREFPSLGIAEPVRVEFTAPGRRVAFARREGRWETAEGGLPFPVNAQGIDRAVRKAGPEFRATDLADPSDLAKLGLDRPTHAITITAGDGTVARITGAGDPSGDRWYVRLDAKSAPDVVWEAAAWEASQLFPAGAGLYTFDAVGVPDETFTKAVIEKGAERIVLTRAGTKPADDWTVESPASPFAPRQSSVRSLASLLRNVKPIDWIDAADLGAVEAVVRLGSRTAADDELATIRIGGKSPAGKDRLAALPAHPGRVLVLADSTVDRLVPAASSLFETKILHGWSASDVASITVEQGGTRWSVAREGDRWTFLDGDVRSAADAAACTKWTEALTALDTGGTTEPAGDDAVDARIVVTKLDGTERAFSIGAAKDGRRRVTFGTAAFTTDRGDLLPARATLAAPPAPKEK